MKHQTTPRKTKRITAGILALLLVFLASCAATPADTASTQSTVSEISNSESSRESATESSAESSSPEEETSSLAEEVAQRVPYTDVPGDDVITYEKILAELGEPYSPGRPIRTPSFYSEAYGKLLTRFLKETDCSPDQKFEVSFLAVAFYGVDEAERNELIKKGFIAPFKGGVCFDMSEKGMLDRAEYAKQSGADVFYSVKTKYPANGTRIVKTQYYAILTLAQMQELFAYGGFCFEIANYQKNAELYLL